MNKKNNESIMTIARDGGISFRPNGHDGIRSAQQAGGAYSPVGGLWHWTDRQPYDEQDVPGLLLSSRPDAWAPTSPDQLAEALCPNHVVRMQTDPRTVADAILESRPAEQIGMAIASARALMMDIENTRVTAVFPDDSQLLLSLSGELLH